VFVFVGGRKRQPFVDSGRIQNLHQRLNVCMCIVNGDRSMPRIMSDTSFDRRDATSLADVCVCGHELDV
jgi:hypothetical protein